MGSKRGIDLYLVGIGIRPSRHITPEVAEAIKHSRIVFHIGEDEAFLKTLNRNLVNLEELYWTNDDRGTVYRRLMKVVRDEMRAGPGVCLITYGHPLLFDDVISGLFRYCRRNKLTAKLLPGISCLDTMSIDLGIDYGDGIQIYEATDVVINRHKLNPRIHTYLLQLGEYQYFNTTDSLEEWKGRFDSLSRYLERIYPADHRVTIVYSDDGDNTVKRNVRLKEIDKHRRIIFPGTTLYVPPLS